MKYFLTDLNMKREIYRELLKNKEEDKICHSNKIINIHLVKYKNVFIFKKNLELIQSLSEKYNFKININNVPIKNDIYFILCDGGSFNNGKRNKDLPMFSSSATIVKLNDKIILDKKIQLNEDSTNNHGEIIACFNGLNFLKLYKEKNNIEKMNIIIVSDSQYVIKGLNQWISNWKINDWKNYQDEKISNYKIWQEIYYEFLNNQKYRIMTQWVRGHGKNLDELFVEENNLVDEMCREVIINQKRKLGLK